MLIWTCWIGSLSLLLRLVYSIFIFSFQDVTQRSMSTVNFLIWLNSEFCTGRMLWLIIWIVPGSVLIEIFYFRDCLIITPPILSSASSSLCNPTWGESNKNAFLIPYWVDGFQLLLAQNLSCKWIKCSTITHSVKETRQQYEHQRLEAR